MVWRKAGGNNEVWKPVNAGDSFTGVYVTTSTFESEKSLSGELVIHTFTAGEKSFSVFGSGKLDWLMKQARSGDNCRITYLGKITVKGREINDWDLEIEYKE